ncbi:MAG: GDSL-type esterase/lipase family protein [Gallintestinimicrobium sp.]
MTLEQALSRHQFKKVYLMIGINEMGTGTPESFFEAYARAVYKIRELQPDAIIFVQGIMRVAGQKNASDPVFNNTNINIRNVEIETLANGKDIFYIDVNEAVCDENGNLYADWTFDQIHLKAKYYQVWENFLMEHGIVKK